MCNAGSRGWGIADVRHPHGRTEYGRLRRRRAGAQAAPRGGAGMQPTKGTGIGHYVRASDRGEGRQEGRYVRSWGGLTCMIWRVMMMVMLCEEVEGEGELIGMSGLGDCWVGGRCAQAKGGGPSSHWKIRTGLGDAAASAGMDTKKPIPSAHHRGPRR